MAHEGSHPSRQANLVLGDLNKDRFAWKRERDTKSWWHGHIRHDLTLQVAVLGGKGQERLMKTVIIPNFYIVLNKSQTLFKELNP